MRKPRCGVNYILLSDGDLLCLWTAKAPAMAPLSRRVGTYARMTLDGMTPRKLDSPRRPPRSTPFLLVGTADGEEVWDGISKEQAGNLFQWVSKEFRKDAQSRPKSS